MTRTPTIRLRTVAAAAVLTLVGGPALAATAYAAPPDPCAALAPAAASAAPAGAPPTADTAGGSDPSATPEPPTTEPPTTEPPADPSAATPGAAGADPSAAAPSADPQAGDDTGDDMGSGVKGDDSGDASDDSDDSSDDSEGTPAAPGESAAPTPDPAAPGTTPLAPGADAGAPACTVSAPVSARPYFQKADWLWNPIPADPVLDPDSATVAGGLAGSDHIANIGDFGVTLRGPDGITADTPRFPVAFSETGNWGPDPFGGKKMPIPADTPIAPGSDGHLAIADPVSNEVYNLWMAKDAGSSWDAGWGAVTPLDGDGRETNGSSTGAGIARFAAVVRESEIEAGDIPHALFFSTDMVRPDEVRYPATKTDGSNDAGQSATIPEGARVQLDPSLDVDSLPGLSPAEKTVATALQTYGAYCGDNGGARMAFLFEYSPDSSTYADNGLTGSYASLENIPFDRLRMLANWDGAEAGSEIPLPAGGES